MKRTFIQTALVAALMAGLSQAAYAGGINSPNGVPVEIGAGGTPNIITVTGAGRVGIANTLPGYTLDVNGDTNIGGNLTVGGNLNVTGTQNAGTRIFMQRDGSNYSWIGAQGTGTDAERDAIGFTSEPDTGKIDQVTINPNLVVGGSVKLGNDANDCTSANTGTIRWNGTAFEACNGTNWLANSKWITVPPGAATGGDSRLGWMNSQNISPTQWCQQNGFAAASGACRGPVPANINLPAAANPAGEMEGTMIANTFAGGSGTWAWDCQFGGLDQWPPAVTAAQSDVQYWMDGSSQILCIQ